MSRLIVVTLISLVAAGCTLGPRYKRPEVAAPAAFRGADTSIDPASGSLADLEWSALFNDPALTAIVTSALKQNFDVRIAAERVLQARAVYRIARSDQFPSVDVSADVVTAGRSREGATPIPDGAERDVTYTQAGFRLSWELDVWGRLRR